MPAQYTPKDIQRFWSHVDKSDGCWNWTGFRFSKRGGYGGFALRYRVRRAHRVAYEITYGSIPTGAYVLHHCDNPACVRPDHLYIGDQFANMRDVKARGRRVWKTGDAVGTARLTMDQVRDIRRLYKRGGILQRELASQFDVDQTTISRVVRGTCYRESHD